MSQFKENLQFYLIKSVLMTLSLFPRKFMGWFGKPLGRLWLLVDKRHRDIASDNIAQAYGYDISDPRVGELVRANFIQLARSVLEMPSLFRLSKKNVDSYAEFENMHYLTDEVAKGKGVLALTAHLGNWELMSLSVSCKTDIPIYELVRPLDSPPLDRIVSELRTRTGNRFIDKDQCADEVRELLGKNSLIAILLDQNASWYEGVYVPFFGRTACTNKGMAAFALSCGASVVPVFNFRQEDGRYKVVFDKPVELIRTDDFKSDLIENTKQFNDVIEKYVRMAPDNWLWVHRRWRIKDIPEEARDKIKGEL